jgi:hypothetical protein
VAQSSQTAVEGAEDDALIQLIADLANTIVTDLGPSEILTRLCDDAATLLAPARVGALSNSEPGGPLEIVTASDPTMHQFLDRQLRRSDGPSIDVFRSGVMLTTPFDSRRDGEELDGPLLAGDLITVQPLQVGPWRVGSLTAIGPPDAANASQVSATLGLLSGVAAALLVNQRLYQDAARLATELRTALESRVPIEQAKGLLAGQLGLDIDEAFRLLRHHARRRRESVRNVAEDLISGGQLDGGQLDAGQSEHP